MTKQIIRLTMAQQFALMNLVKEEYPIRKQTDEEFAIYAIDVLDFRLNENHIHGARKALGIESTRALTSSPAQETRLTLVERRLKDLEDKFHNHLNHPHLPPAQGGYTR